MTLIFTWNMKSPIWLSCASPFLKHWMYSSVMTMNRSFHRLSSFPFCTHMRARCRGKAEEVSE